MNLILFEIKTLVAYLKSLLYEITPELLNFCWKNLKYKYNSTHKFSLKGFNDYYIPFRWFVKVSYLLKLGRLKYSKYLCGKNDLRKELFAFSTKEKNFKYLVLQKALICVLKPRFSEYLQSSSFSLVSCLRMVIHR